MDHNEDKYFAAIGEIVQVIDHHVPSLSSRLQRLRESDSSKVVIDPTTGSCCTLVAESFLSLPESIHPEPQTSTQAALLLYGPIILGKG